MPVRVWCVCLFLAGLAIRAVLVWVGPAEVGSEALNIAATLATRGEFADAYAPGSGPTAHCAPIYPLLCSILFRLFGTGHSGILAVEFFASVCSSAAYAVLPALSRSMGAGTLTGVLAGLAGAVLPLNFWSQTSGAFETSLSAVAITAGAVLELRLRRTATWSLDEAALQGIGIGLTAMTAPVLLPVLAVWLLGRFLIRPPNTTRLLRFSAVCGLCAATVSAPWALRNALVLGSPVLTRSNFGLEFYLSNHEGTSADGDANMKSPTWQSLHPFSSPAQREQVRVLGEVKYNSLRLEEGLLWARQNPLAFFARTLERIALFWFPRLNRLWQAGMEWLITLLAVAGAVALIRRDKLQAASVVIGGLVAYFSAYALIQVTARYRFPAEPLLFLLAAYACRRAKGVD